MAPGKTKSMRTVKKLGGGKRNKWNKGQSSCSNPNTFKHRENVKVGVGFLGHSTGNRKGGLSLTEQALKKLDDDDDARMPGDDNNNDDDVASQNSSGATFKTWATGFTNCTNASFDKVLLYSNGDSAMRKEILAVLAAVTDAIKSQGGKETETEYFAALLTVVDTLVTAGSGGDEGPAGNADSASATRDTLTAATYLLSLVLRRVSEGVLRKKFAEASKVLMKVLVGVAGDPPTSLAKSTMRCLARILRVQELAVWKESYSLQVFQSLLSFSISEKPKVRSASQIAVCSILRGSTVMLSPSPPPSHPAAAAVAKYAIMQIEESGGQRSSLATLHVFELLKEILATFPSSSLKAVCETLLRVMTLGNVLVLTKAFDVFHATFKKHPPTMTAELNAQLLAALYELQPHLKDAQPSAAWLTVMWHAHVNLWRSDPALALSHLPKIFGTCLTFLLVNDDGLVATAKQVLSKLFEDCLKNIDGELKETLMKSTRADSSSSSSVLHRIFGTVESCLNFQYHAVWDHSIAIVGELFLCLGDFFKYPSSPVFACLRSLADLRETPSFSHKPALDSAIGRAVKKCGPEFVLSAVPLTITGGDEDRLDFPRSWLLPVLRDNVENTELGFFVKYFLPLSSKLFNRAVAKTKEGLVAEAKSYELLQYQIWCLLPGFCTRAVDVPVAFKAVAKTFGILLQERNDIRNELMSSLRNLVTKAVDDAAVAEVKRFAKNYLPILFNLYTSEGEIGSSPLAVLETIRVFISLADASVIHTFVEKLFPKLEEEGIAVERRIKLLDIAVAMTPYMNEDSIAQTLALVTAHLKVDDKAVQKKCYRIVEEICRKSDSAFVKCKLDDLSKTLVSSLSLAGASSKAPRLRSLAQLVDSFREPRIEFLHKLIPEAVVCCNASSSGKTKIAACSFLSKAVEKLILWNAAEKTKSRVVGDLLELLCAGFAGTTDSIAAATSAIAHVLKEHWKSVEDDSKAKIFQMTLVLLRSGKKPILKHGLGLAKFLLKKSNIRDFGNNVRELTTVLGELSESEKKSYRKVIRIILSVSLKTLGVDVLHKMVPECFGKVVLNIHKTQLKKAAAARKSAAEGDDGDNDDDDDVEKPKPGGGESFEDMLGDDSDVEAAEDDEKKQRRPKVKAKRSKTGGSWLEEKAGEEEIVDLLDPSAASKVLASKPREEEKKKGIRHEFKMAPDGRFVVTTREDEEEGKKKKKDEVKLEMNELMDALEGAAAVGKKRKIKWKDEDDSDEEEDKEGPKKYEAGGRGIHRPLGGGGGGEKGRKKSAGGMGVEYRSTKAKGDMKRKGKPDPYAYIPLDAKTLNKRKAKKMQGKFKNVVGAAKKGALKGKKLKVKRSKQN